MTMVHSAEDGCVPSAQEDRPATSLADILDRAADLIEPEGAWTQRALGRNANGRCADADRMPKKPVCFCAVGAVCRVLGLTTYTPYGAAHRPLEALRTSLPRVWSLTEWNDAKGRTQAEVVAALRQAASAERAKATGAST